MAKSKSSIHHSCSQYLGETHSSLIMLQCVVFTGEERYIGIEAEEASTNSNLQLSKSS